MNRWQDSATRKAFKEGYAARSVYKLKEINNKYAILKAKDCVVDLGCHPGSWAKYALEIIGSQGQVLAYDLKPTTIIGKNAQFFPKNVYELTPHEILQHVPRVDVLLSDMMPSTTGHLDQENSFDLAHVALTLAMELHARAVVIKFFQGPQEKELLTLAREYYSFVKAVKPTTSRSKSKEMFLVGQQKA